MLSAFPMCTPRNLCVNTLVCTPSICVRPPLVQSIHRGIVRAQPLSGPYTGGFVHAHPLSLSGPYTGEIANPPLVRSIHQGIGARPAPVQSAHQGSCVHTLRTNSLAYRPEGCLSLCRISLLCQPDSSNDWVAGCCLQVSKISPSMGPHLRGVIRFQLAMGWPSNRNLRVSGRMKQGTQKYAQNPKKKTFDPPPVRVRASLP